MEKLGNGIKLGRFTLEKRLAVGGMAEIWLAHETVAGEARELALKILLASFARDPGARAMFFDEVNIASRLSHENIVQVYEAFEAEGHLVQAMELVDGRDLRRTLSAAARQGKRVPIPIALRVAREIAHALDYAHTKTSDDGKPLGIVHRDISPHNVMLTRDGGVKVLDFGIARAAERITRTRTGVIKGKLSYMAPEQALAVSVSQRSDIFSTGILLWEMLAMQRLFKADSDAEVMERVMQADVPPVRAYNPEVPEDVAVLLGQMLAKRESMRPESMHLVAAKLEHIMGQRFRPEQTGRAALAAWYQEVEEKGTKVLPKIEPQATEPGRPAASDHGPRVLTPEVVDVRAPTAAPAIAIDRTLTMSPAELLGASGAHVLPEPPGAESITEPPGVLQPVTVPSGEVPLVDVAAPTTDEHVVVRGPGTASGDLAPVSGDLSPSRGASADLTLRDLGSAAELYENAGADPTAKMEQPTPEELGLVTAAVRVRDYPREGAQTVAVTVPPGMVMPPPPASTHAPALTRPLESTSLEMMLAAPTVPPAAPSAGASAGAPSLAPVPPSAAAAVTQTFIGGATETPTPLPPPEQPAQRMRRPTRSEIFRAIDGVKTEPVTIDQAATLLPPKPAAKIFDQALQAKMAELPTPMPTRDPASSRDPARDPAETPAAKLPGVTGEVSGEPTLSGALSSAAVRTLARELEPSVESSWNEVTSEEVESATFAPMMIPLAEERQASQAGLAGANLGGPSSPTVLPGPGGLSGQGSASSAASASSAGKAAGPAYASSAARPGKPTSTPPARLTAPPRPELSLTERLGPRWTAAFVLAMLTVIVLSLVLIFIKR